MPRRKREMFVDYVNNLAARRSSDDFLPTIVKKFAVVMRLMRSISRAGTNSRDHLKARLALLLPFTVALAGWNTR